MELPEGWRECPQHSGWCFLVPNWPESGRTGAYYSFSYQGITREEALQKTIDARDLGLGENIPAYVPEVRVEAKPRPVFRKVSQRPKDTFSIGNLPKPKQLSMFEEEK